MADEQIDRAEIEIEVTGDAAKRLEEIENRLLSLENQLSSFQSSLGNLEVSGLEKVASSAENVSSSLKKIGGESSFKISLDGASQSADSVTDSLENLLTFTNKSDILSYKLADIRQKMLELLQVGATLENSEPLRNLTTQAQNLQANIDKLNDKTTQSSNSFSRLSLIGRTAFNGLKKSTEKLFSPINKLRDKTNSLFRSIKRIMLYRAIRAVLRSITEAIKTGTNDIYQYSKALGGVFANNLDRVSTSMLYFKNSIGAAIASLINAITPIVERLIDRFAELGNKIAAFFAVLTGAGSYSKAIKYNKEYAESANKVAEANNNAIASFDELNLIKTNQSSLGANELDYSKMFEETKTPINGLASELANQIKRGNWNEVGKILAEKLNGQIKKIDEQHFGKKIAEKINNAVQLTNGFLKKFNFIGAAKLLTQAITDFINEIDWANLGNTFTALILGVFDFIETVADWIGADETRDSIFDALTDLIDNIDWEDLSRKFIESLSKLVKSAVKWALDFKNWEELYKSVSNALKAIGRGALDGLKEGIKDWFSDKSLGKLIIQFLERDLRNGLNLLFPGFGNLVFPQSKVTVKTKNGFGGAFATGGFPNQGEMFIAREAGPELVGTINSRPAVANNDQIVEAVSRGVYNAVVDAMSKTPTQDSGDTIIQIDGREVFRSMQKQNSAYRKRTGANAW